MTILIEEDDVKIARLAVELERAVIAYSLDDESIYVTEDGYFPIWISIHEEVGLICFVSHTNFRTATSQIQRLEIANALNAQNCFITAFVKDEKLRFEYVLNFRDGILRANVIRAVRLFIRNIERGLQRADSERNFVLAPGELETHGE